MSYRRRSPDLIARTCRFRAPLRLGPLEVAPAGDLEEADWQDWLDPDEHDPARLAGLLVPSDDDTLVRHPVSTDVNRPANDGP